MKKVTMGKALTTMIDTIKAKEPGMTQKSIAKQIPCGADYLSRMIAREESGERVPSTLLLKIEKKFEYVLTGKKTVYGDQNSIVESLKEENLALSALVHVFMKETMGVLANHNGLSIGEMEARIARSCRAEVEQRTGKARF